MARSKKERTQIEQDDSDAAQADKNLAAIERRGDVGIGMGRALIRQNSRASNEHDRTGEGNGPS